MFVCVRVCVPATDATLVLMVQHTPQQFSVSIADVGLNQMDQLVPVSLAHHQLLGILSALLQDGKSSNHFMPFRPDQLPHLLLSHTKMLIS